MYTTAERLNNVKARLNQYRRKRENHLLRTLCVICFLLLFSLVKIIESLSSSEHGSEISGMQGAIMIYEDAGSYILVAIISFVVAVVITLLCMRYRKK